MSERPIGVFDSGVGGLTVLKALTTELPRERFIYLGDTARLPYGTKSAETVARYAVQAARTLLEYDVKCLVVACNTASSVGLPAIRERILGIPLIGVIEPGAEAACAASKSGHIAVIATEGTVRGGSYQGAILRLREGARVVARAAQLFVALAEEGLSQGPIAEAVARHYLNPLFNPEQPESTQPSEQTATVDAGASPDTLVLGCTHFPLLGGAIRAAVGPRVQIVDSAATTARSVLRMLVAQGLTCEAGTGAVRYLATDSVERFARIGSGFLERPIQPEEVELIDLSREAA